MSKTRKDKPDDWMTYFDEHVQWKNLHKLEKSHYTHRSYSRLDEALKEAFVQIGDWDLAAAARDSRDKPLPNVHPGKTPRRPDSKS